VVVVFHLIVVLVYRYSCAYHMVPPPLRSSLSESESESSSGSAADTAGTTSPSIPLFELRPVSLPTPLVSRDNSSHRDGEAEAAAPTIEEVESHEGQAERKTHRLEVIDDRYVGWDRILIFFFSSISDSICL